MYIQYTINIVFEWDLKKNQDNGFKHKVWFEEAQTVWADSLAVEFYDEEHSESEERFIRIGTSSSGNLLLVVYLEKEDEHMVRLISARRVSLRERRQYEEGL